MAKSKSKIVRRISATLIALTVLVGTLAFSYAQIMQTANGACATLSDAHGKSVNTVTVATAGTYTIWVRMKTPTSNVNSVSMQLDSGASLCTGVVGGTTLSANTWTWVNWQNGNISSTLSQALTAGSHTFSIAGIGDGVQVDNVILSLDGDCTPTGTGTNCTAPVDAPTVSISASPTSAKTGGSSTLTWSSTGSPSSCTATGDWSGTKAASGTTSTGTLSTAKTYSYGLSCTNSGGTSATATATVGVTAVVVPPVVTINASPAALKAGASSTLTWSSTGSPTSCTATGDWSGTKASSGTLSTGALSTVKTYSYGLSCTNSGGTSSVSTATVIVSAATPVVIAPVVTISANPTSLTIGSSSTITWSSTNSPTSCTATGDWSGTKSASGTFSTGALSTAKTYTYGLTCTNSGGTSPSVSTAVVVKANTGTYKSGDINQDGKVNLLDFSLLSSDFGKSGSAITHPRSDINGDGKVNLLDFSVLASQFGS